MSAEESALRDAARMRKHHAQHQGDPVYRQTKRATDARYRQRHGAAIRGRAKYMRVLRKTVRRDDG